MVDKKKFLSAYYTPHDLAETITIKTVEILSQICINMQCKDIVVVEPSCGDGAFVSNILKHIPYSSRYYFVDIDEDAINSIKIILQNSKNNISLINYDFLKINEDVNNQDICLRIGDVNVFIGNPPFNSPDGKEIYPVFLEKIMKLCVNKTTLVSFILNRNIIYARNKERIRNIIENFFDYVLYVDLGGDSREHKEYTDQNFFNISVGICVVFMVKISNENNYLAKKKKLIRFTGSKEDKIKQIKNINFDDIFGSVNTKNKTNTILSKENVFLLSDVFHEGITGHTTKKDKSYIFIDPSQCETDICILYHYRAFNYLYTSDSKIIGSKVFRVYGKHKNPGIIFYDRRTIATSRRIVLPTIIPHDLHTGTNTVDRSYYLYAADNNLIADKIYNIKEDFMNKITGLLGFTPTYEDVFYYIYFYFYRIDDTKKEMLYSKPHDYYAFEVDPDLFHDHSQRGRFLFDVASDVRNEYCKVIKKYEITDIYKKNLHYTSDSIQIANLIIWMDKDYVRKLITEISHNIRYWGNIHPLWYFISVRVNKKIFFSQKDVNIINNIMYAMYL